jgi:hypothetical protein
MTRTMFAAPLLAALALTGCDLQTETFTHSASGATAPIKKIVTNLDVGDVTVQPSTGAAAVFVEAEAQWLGKRPNVTFREDGTTLFVTSSCLDEDPQCRVDITLSIPLDATFEVHGEETNITASHLGGAAILDTAVGDILLDDLKGTLGLTVGEGQIRGDNLMSPTVTTTMKEEGPTTLSFKGGADTVSVTSNVGTVRLVVPPTIYRIDATTGDGELDIGVAKSSTAKRRITAHARRGDISIQPQAVLIHEPLALKFGQTVKFADEPISLAFTGVVEDSRCPIGVQCVWAGRCVVAMTLTRADGSERDFEVTLGKPAAVYGYSVQLLDAVPYPLKEDAQPNEALYILTVAVERV